MRRNSLLDHAAMGLALVGQSAPTFFIGILLILVLALRLDLFPTSGRGDWRNLVLPALTLGAFTMASIARITRSAVLEVLRADFVRTARAKGVGEFWVVAKHTLRNAALPILTITGLQFGTLLGGAVVTETVFAWPGIGRLAIQSIYNRDYPVVQSTVFIAAVLFIAINLVAGRPLRRSSTRGRGRDGGRGGVSTDALAMALPAPAAAGGRASRGRSTPRASFVAVLVAVAVGGAAPRPAQPGARLAPRAAQGARRSRRRTAGPTFSGPTTWAATCSPAWCSARACP